MKIDTLKALRSMRIDPFSLKSLASAPETRAELESFKIDVDTLVPKLSREIEIDQAVGLLMYYAKVCKYPRAKELLAEAEEIAKKPYKKQAGG